MNVYDFCSTHLMRVNYCMNAKFYEKKIVNETKILVFKTFGIVYDYVKSMVEEWCGTIVTHRK